MSVSPKLSNDRLPPIPLPLLDARVGVGLVSIGDGKSNSPLSPPMALDRDKSLLTDATAPGV
eukprot:CAMPEP_0197237358 /NCGR_PEP_ID=MMETSP1429-20130617/4208_1 /TAXON_ID=49237 /ORGANISM="Chaetoceros  sp., Strain UNC1202" /LENGTH=61 /DNA_ID=CAMNT_0042696341 /DNA_START=111 /DNA_END=296 /DNA_ORIENTATION=+